MEKAYGRDRAKKLKRRLMQLMAAENLSEIPNKPPARCHELTGKLKGVFSVDLSHPWRLLFKPDHDPIPKKEDGGIDLKKVTAITVIDVEDTH